MDIHCRRGEEGTNAAETWDVKVYARKKGTSPMDSRNDCCILAEGRFLRVLSRSGWEWVERTNTSGAVVIAAITAERQLVLVEQYRIPLDRRVIELPAGWSAIWPRARKKGSRRRHAASSWKRPATRRKASTYLFDGPSSSGLTNEVFTLVLARDVRKVGPGGGDATEDIRVHVVPLDQIEAWLASKRREGLHD